MAAPEVRWLLRPNMELQAVARWFSCRKKLALAQAGEAPAPGSGQFLCPGFNPEAMSVEAQCRDRCWKGNYDALLAWLNTVLAGTFPDAAAVVVLDWLHSYRAPHERPTLRVEVIGATAASVASRAQIVKLALPEQFEIRAAEGEGPAAARPLARPGKTAAERLKGELAGYVRLCGDDAGRDRPVFAAVSQGYKDRRGVVYSLKYNDAENTLSAVDNVVSLERAVLDACKGGQPSLESIDACLVQLFAAMEDACYRHAWPEPGGGSNRASQYLVQRLRKGLQDWRGVRENDQSPTTGQEASQARAEVVWALRDPGCEFMDPVLYFNEEAMPPMPEMLVGMSHGDLHARNVLVGIVEGEARWPILFDFEDVTCCNLVAWDFVKLETELKKTVLADPAILPAENDAEFIRRLYEFEVGLCKRTESCYNHNHWPLATYSEVTAALSSPLPTGDNGPRAFGRQADALTRFAHVLLTIRRMAWKCLERQRRRSRKWLHEYYFTQAAYGVFATRFPVFRETRPLKTLYVGAGVAAYRHAYGEDLASRTAQLREIDARDLLARNGSEQDAAQRPANRPAGGVLEPWGLEQIRAHQGDLAYAKKLARSRRLERVQEALGLLRELMREHPFVLELAYECAFALLEKAQLTEGSIGDCSADQLRESCWDEADRLLRRAKILFHSQLHEELLSRAGRLAKDQADYWLKKNKPEQARRYYREAAKQYGDATRAPGGHYYSGVNEATCWLLAQDIEQARRKAEAVLARLKTEEQNARRQPPGEEFMWVLASKGEALIVAGSQGWRNRAEQAYREALDIERAEDQSKQIRATMFHQLERILGALKDSSRMDDAESLQAMINSLQ